MKARVINPLRPNNDLSQTSHYNIKGLSTSEVLRINAPDCAALQVYLPLIDYQPQGQ